MVWESFLYNIVTLLNLTMKTAPYSVWEREREESENEKKKKEDR